jgi:predicted nucleotidyltransferase/DNA-binding transcriptional ArsR family regulator
MRLITSELALKVMMALRHSGPASLAKLAGVLRVRPSSCQRALEVLLDDHLVIAIGEGRERQYVLAESQASLAVEQLADISIPSQEALIIVGNANPAVEFVGLTSDRAISVFGKRSTTADRSRAIDAITRLARALSIQPKFLHHEDLRRSRERTAELRRQLSGGKMLVGHLDRSIPDRSGHRKTAGQALGHLSPALPLPSSRTLQSLKRRHGVSRLKVFGSAVRSDFRPDSDVDIAVTLDPTLSPSVRNLEALEADLERRLGHDVDLVLESELRPPVRYVVKREAVAL